MNVKPFGRSRPRLRRFDFAVTRRSVGYKRVEQVPGSVGNLVHGAVESFFVRLGRLGEAAQFPDELKRRRANFSSVAGGAKLCRVLMFRHMKASSVVWPNKDAGGTEFQARRSLVCGWFSFLPRQPLVKLRSIVNVEDIMIALGKRGEFRPAASGFNGAD